MQYETIILELLSRIKKLEDDVNELKQFYSAFQPLLNSDDGDGAAGAREAAVAYKKMTDEMIDLCYEYGKKVCAGKNVHEAASEISASTGMNKNSAVMYLYAVQGMLEGKIYKRAVSAKATEKYYEKIVVEYGSEGLKKTLRATRLHIDYRRNCGQNVDSIEEICNSYENRL